MDHGRRTGGDQSPLLPRRGSHRPGLDRAAGRAPGESRPTTNRIGIARSGSAMVFERVSLFGLPIVPRRRVPLGPVDPATARQLLIQHGLVEGGAQQETRLSRTQPADYCARSSSWPPGNAAPIGSSGSRALYQFYDRRLPDDVTDLRVPVAVAPQDVERRGRARHAPRRPARRQSIPRMPRSSIPMRWPFTRRDFPCSTDSCRATTRTASR